MSSEARTTTISSKLMARGYDFLNAVLWLPSGSDHLRKRFVEALDISPGMRVLELGCGTGLVTRHLLAVGADVVAVDASGPMLDRARKRSSKATFHQGDLVTTAAEYGADFDRVVFGFVLHELSPEDRIDTLRSSAELLNKAGQIGILEWGYPSGRLSARIWKTIVKIIEPPVAHDILDGAIERAIDTADLQTADTSQVAQGRAVITVAKP